MILKDFETGGFPISRTVPVICFSKDDGYFVAYDNSSLSDIISNHNIDSCVGVWPGKKNTDCFSLSTEHYGKIRPPKNHEKIDYASDIEIVAKNKEFILVKYFYDGSTCESTDKELADYVLKTGLKYTVVHE